MFKNFKLKISNFSRGFTLVELLVVMAILSTLVALIAGSFRNAQFRGRDAQRKANLKQVAGALEAFMNDYGLYPNETSGKITACPYVAGGASSVCTWGEGELTDNKTVYFKELPQDPASSAFYLYRIVPGSNNQKFQLFARLENTEDQDIITTAYFCGDKICNFAITSANTKPTE